MPLTTLPLARRSRSLTASPILPALFPVLVFLGYHAGGEIWLAALGLGLPAIWLLLWVLPSHFDKSKGALAPFGLESAEDFESRVAELLSKASDKSRTTAAFMIEVDETKKLTERFAETASDQILDTMANRLPAATRGHDLIVRLSNWRIAIVLDPIGRFDLETAVQMATRLQREFEEPIRVNNTPAHVTASVGFCLANRAPSPGAAGLIEGAVSALDEARRHGPGTIRAYSPDLQRRGNKRTALRDEAAKALEDGEICAWFQPQVSAQTGAITGMEALARWHHSARGMIPPNDFLPALDAAGLSERLGEVILYGALGTLRDLDNFGAGVPGVGVNFSLVELQDPRLPKRLEWELDRFDLEPERLSIEINEQVVADAVDDVVLRNLSTLAGIGCKIDLDDFGTANASNENLQRIAIDRLKIHRVFIDRCDEAPDKRQNLTTLLVTAKELGLDTLAVGVETPAEREMLADLGFGHVQGFGVAPPMPAGQIAEWISTYETRQVSVPHFAHPTDQAQRKAE